MTILSHSTPSVNSTPADSDQADRLAWLNDSPDNDILDGYPGPGWQEIEADDDQPGPSSEDEFFETGRSIGLEGYLAFVEETSLGHRASADSPERQAFALGNRAGRIEHARRSGHAWGLDGKPFADGAVHECGWWNDAFGLGYLAGSIERAEREREMADYFQQLDWEREYEIELREIETICREVGGWDRAGNRSLV